TQVEGLGVLVAPGEGACDDAAHAGADYALALDGDLVGCIYGYITSYHYQETSGTYQERADEFFVGNWGDLTGTFDMVENFSGKFDPVTGEQLFGRCKHPIVAGSGTGDFAGITGRLDFTDDVDAGNVPYRGHLSLGS
ncbi:MAG: DUF3224 domain-containing protein, partial [Acidimicrobiia bacterium]|nr:DUF3224 domain-containing protein [Acidimicrobiia bacterium]